MISKVVSTKKRKGFGLIEVFVTIMIMSAVTASTVPKIGETFEKPKDLEVLRDLKIYEDAATLLMPTLEPFTEENISRHIEGSLKLTGGKSKAKNPYGKEYIINVIDDNKFTVTSNKYVRGEFKGSKVLRVERAAGKLVTDIKEHTVVPPPKIPDPPEDVEQYYNFTPTGWGGYKVELHPNFRTAIESNLNYIDWIAGSALPNPGGEYNGELVYSMYGMFENLNVESIDLSQFDTTNVDDMGRMFYNSKMVSIDLSNFITINLSSMEEMFMVSSAININLSNFETPSLKYMGSTFSKSNVKNLDLRHFDTSKVQDFGYTFYYADAENIEISGINTSSATRMEGMFCGTKDTTIDISSFNTSKVSEMAYMFAESQMSSIDIRHFDTSKVVDFNYTFFLAEADTVNISGINTSSATTMEGMLYGVKDPNLDITSFNTVNVTNMAIMLYGVQMDVIDLSSFSFANTTLEALDCIVMKTKATVGYAKTTTAATKLNNSPGKPAGLTFVVKP